MSSLFFSLLQIKFFKVSQKGIFLKTIIKILTFLFPLIGYAQDNNSIDPYLINEWSVEQSELNGKPIFLRSNVGFKLFKDKNNFPYRIGFAFPLLNPKINGLPTDSEMNQLNEIEDLLDKRLVKKKSALLTLVITTVGMREFVFYSNQPDTIKKQIDSIKRSIMKHELQFYIEKDKNWSVYKEFTN